MIRGIVIGLLMLGACSTVAACVYSLAVSEAVCIYKRTQSRSSTFMFVVDGYEVRVWHFLLAETPRTTRKTEVAFLGFALLSEVGPTPVGTWFLIHRVSCPVWALFPILAAYPAVVFLRGPLRRRYSRAYRREQGLCVECWYDLTGNVSGVCPECGTRIGLPDDEIGKSRKVGRKLLLVVVIVAGAWGLQRVVRSSPWLMYRRCEPCGLKKADVDKLIGDVRRIPLPRDRAGQFLFNVYARGCDQETGTACIEGILDAAER